MQIIIICAGLCATAVLLWYISILMKGDTKI